jgi:hypothetical protein
VAETTRPSCPLPQCSWKYPGPLPEGDVGGRPNPAARHQLATAEGAVGEHLRTHSTGDWAGALLLARSELDQRAVERDQYRAASRHLALRIRQMAHAWATQLPETIRTAAAVEALMGIAAHVPDRPELRDDLWMRIAGAYEARFEDDGHPEDARRAADEAMSVVQPVLDELRAERDRARASLRAQAYSKGETILEWTNALIASEVADRRLEAIREAVVVWRDRPGGDVGLAVALAGILDTEQPDPPAATALVRVLAECDRIEREVYGQHDEDDDGMREAVRRVRAAAGPVCEGCGGTGACAGGPCAHPDAAKAGRAWTDPGDDAWGSVWLHGDWRQLTRQMDTPAREHAAAAVMRWMRALDAVDGRPARPEPEELRWWRG